MNYDDTLIAWWIIDSETGKEQLVELVSGKILAAKNKYGVIEAVDAGY